MSSYRILVVGGGLTSALTAASLAEKLPQSSVVVWDKARGAGGRMATSRSPNNSECTVDLGAQYISASPAGQSEYKEIYDRLLEAGTLVPVDTSQIQGFRPQAGYVHYTAPAGMSAVVKQLLSGPSVQATFNRRVSTVDQLDRTWLVKTECGHQEIFDGVVLTMPVPQILGLEGTLAERIRNETTVHKNLQDVKYSARFALGLFYDENIDLRTSWSCNYLTDHPIFRYVAIDNLKRGRVSGPTSVLAHTSVPFGMENIEVSPEDMKAQLVDSLHQLFPAWPPAAASKCLKWRYSQVSRPYAGSPNSLMLTNGPPLVLAGDGFAATSNFEGCLASAFSAAASMYSTLQK